MTKAITREQWLEHAVEMIRAPMLSRGVTIPPVKVSCSWAGGGDSQKRIGECWPTKASKAKINEIFVSPRIEDPVKVVSILAHELVHAVDDCKNKHSAVFKAIGLKMGLEGKPTQMMPTAQVAQAWAGAMVAKHGPFPHAMLDKSKSPVKSQKNRHLKCVCSECGGAWRMSATVIASAIGELSCPVCHTQEEGAVQIEG